VRIARPLARAVAAGGLVTVLVGLPPASGLQAQGSSAQLRYSVVAERSEARYRIREQLASLNFPNDAVGATRAIAGAIVLDARGQVVSGASRFTVDLRTLQSDESRRDNYVRRNTLETDRYPTAVFVPTEIRGLAHPLPAAGAVPLELVGDFTLRERTERITWKATATFEGVEVSVRATTAFRFGDFGLRIPRVASVLSVEDNIRLELDLRLRRS
jgi:polyisoprenoid-binding protein YceI